MDQRLSVQLIDNHQPQNLAPAYAADVFKARHRVTEDH